MRLQIVLNGVIVEQRIVDVEQKDDIVHGSPERKRRGGRVGPQGLTNGIHST
jgi:hypothetical protein